MKAWIVGAGAQGRVVLDVLRARRCYESIAFVDDNCSLHGRRINDAPVIGGLDAVLVQDCGGVEMIVALGNPSLRINLARRIAERGIALLNAVHPSAVVMPSVRMGAGNMIGAMAVVNTDVQIGSNTIINTSATVEHDCYIEDGVMLGPGANIGGRVHLEQCSFIATGAIVLARTRIGQESVVGAGSLVTKDLPPRVLAMGAPARITERFETFHWKRVL